MILVSDSGSTKTDWVLVSSKGLIHRTRTSGINPYNQSDEEIGTIISGLNKNLKIEKVKHVYYYGAGCADEDNKKIVLNALQSRFGFIDIEVNSDLLASARALFKNKNGIACILGTGSGIGYYDGSELIDIQSGLGYLLADEASGSYFGRKLLVAVLRGNLPLDLQKKFTKIYGGNQEVLKKLYQANQPNVILASYCKFIGKEASHPFAENLVSTGIKDFIDNCLLPMYKKYECQVGFIGSISYAFSDIIDQAISAYGVGKPEILKAPIDELVNYHLETANIESQ